MSSSKMIWVRERSYFISSPKKSGKQYIEQSTIPEKDVDGGFY